MSLINRTSPIGIRLCQIYFIFEICILWVFAFLCPPAMFEYDLSLIRILLLMAGGASTIWLISRKAASARIVGITTALIYLVLSLIDHAAFGGLEILATYIGYPPTLCIAAFEYVGAVMVATYLLLSPQARRYLSEPPDLEPGSEHDYTWETPLKQRVKKWEFWRDLLIYFIVFSLLGHWLEMLFCQLIVAGVFMGGYDPNNTMLWSQWLFPFTAEGAAAVAIVFLLHPAARWLLKKTGNRVVLAVILSFLLNALVCTSIDFTTGMVANQNYELWDYRDMPFNFIGQVCLQNSMVYSIAVTLIVWVFYPLMDKGLHRAPRGVANAIAVGLIGVYIFLALLYFVDISAVTI